MPTNFPTTLDTAVELGGAWANLYPVTDAVHNIDAQYRTNIKDAMFAVEARIGAVNSAVPSSHSWALLSAGGVDNLGLRFQQGEAQWPGAVGESGVFLYDASLEPMFHRAGEPVTTYYPLVGGSASTWDGIYAADKTYEISSDTWEITQTSTADYGISVVRDQAAAVAPIVYMQNAAAADDQEVLYIDQAADAYGLTILGTGGKAFYTNGGVVDFAHSAAISTGTTVKHVTTATTSTNLTHASAVLVGHYIGMTPSAGDTNGNLVGQWIDDMGATGSATKVALLLGPLSGTTNLDVGITGNARFYGLSRTDAADVSDDSVVRSSYTNSSDITGTMKQCWVDATVGGGTTGNIYGFVSELKSSIPSAASAAAFWARATNWHHAFWSDGGLWEGTQTFAAQTGAGQDDKHCLMTTNSGGMAPSGGTAIMSSFVADMEGHASDTASSDIFGFWARTLAKNGGSASAAAFRVESSWDYALQAQSGILDVVYTSPAISSATTVSHLDVQTTSGNLTNASAVLNGARIRVSPGTDTAGWLQGLQIQSTSGSAGASISVGLTIGDSVSASSNFDYSLRAFSPAYLDISTASTANTFWGVENQLTQTAALTSSGQHHGVYYGEVTPEGTDSNGYYHGAVMHLVSSAASATAIAYDVTGVVAWDYAFRSASGKVLFISQSALGSELLELDQQDADQPFVYFNGTASNPAAGSLPADNVTEINGAGSVAGPQRASGSPDTGWNFKSMVRAKVDLVGGGTTEAWICLYEPEVV